MADVNDTDTKPWYLSKTLWVNVIAGLAMIIQAHYGFIIAVDEQAAIIVLANLLLRAVSKDKLTLHDDR